MATGTIKSTGWKLFWTNPSPSADFAAQTVPLDLSAYSEFVITYRQWKADTKISNQQYFFGYADKAIVVISPILINGQVYLAARQVAISSTGITFSEAGSKTSLNGNAITDNGWIVPYQIYAR